MELANGRTHFTWFEKNGQRSHEQRGWELVEVADGVRAWVIIATKKTVLKQQVGNFQKAVSMPTTDEDRRNDEFVRYAQSTHRYAVPVPPTSGDTLMSVLSIVDDLGSLTEARLRSAFPLGKYIDEWVSGWPDGEFPVATFGLTLEQVSLLVLTTSPPGQLNGDCVVGALSRPRHQ